MMHTGAGLRLDTATEAEARALLARAHAQCDDRARGYRYLRCRGVDAGALALAGPPVSAVWLSFDGAGRLVGVDLYWRGMAPAELRTVWSGATRALRKTLGTPLRRLHGDRDRGAHAPGRPVDARAIPVGADVHTPVIGKNYCKGYNIFIKSISRLP